MKRNTYIIFFLFFIIIFCILVHSSVSLAALIIISLVSFKEFNLLTRRVFSIHIFKKSKLIRNGNIRGTIQILSFLYLSLFTIISYVVIDADRIFFIYILLICISSDIGGYVFGKTFGGKKLTKISPNKTISGSCGSFIFSVLPFFVFYNFYKNTDYFLLNKFYSIFLRAYIIL